MLLAAVTFYHNPLRQPRRLQNYYRFRDGLLQQGVHLLTVEHLLPGQAAELQAQGEQLLRIHGGAVMGQKERLLNYAIEQLPAEFDAVAWLDPDILLLAPQWPRQAEQLLAERLVIQLFQVALCLDSSESEYNGAGKSVPSYLAARSCGAAFGLTGVAWAAHRSLLATHGLYDGCIAGGGADAWALAMAEAPENASGRSPAMQAHLQRWAAACSGAVQGQHGFLPHAVVRLWSRDEEQAGDADPAGILREGAFDPATDLRLSAGGAWEWTRPELALSTQLAGALQLQEEEWARGEPQLVARQGVLTCAAPEDFADTLHLVQTLRARASAPPVHVIDLGLSAQQRQQLAELAVTWSRFDGQRLARRAGLSFRDTRAWSLPLWLARSPFAQTLFVEPGQEDTELAPLFTLLSQDPLLPSAPRSGATSGGPGGTILGIDRVRDQGILRQWTAWVWDILAYPDKRKMLQWALVNLEEMASGPTPAVRQ